MIEEPIPVHIHMVNGDVIRTSQATDWDSMLRAVTEQHIWIRVDGHRVNPDHIAWIETM